MVKQLDYSNEWIWKRSAKSPDRNHVAKILCRHDVNSMDLYMLIQDKTGNEVLKEQILSTLPDEFSYSAYLGPVKWLSNDEVALVSKNGDVKRVVCIE